MPRVLVPDWPRLRAGLAARATAPAPPCRRGAITPRLKQHSSPNIPINPLNADAGLPKKRLLFADQFIAIPESHPPRDQFTEFLVRLARQSQPRPLGETA